MSRNDARSMGGALRGTGALSEFVTSAASEAAKMAFTGTQLIGGILI